MARTSLLHVSLSTTLVSHFEIAACKVNQDADNKVPKLVFDSLGMPKTTCFKSAMINLASLQVSYQWARTEQSHDCGHEPSDLAYDYSELDPFSRQKELRG